MFKTPTQHFTGILRNDSRIQGGVKAEPVSECQRETRGHDGPLLMRCSQLKAERTSGGVVLGGLRPDDVLISWHYVTCFPVMLSWPGAPRALLLQAAASTIARGSAWSPSSESRFSQCCGGEVDAKAEGSSGLCTRSNGVNNRSDTHTSPVPRQSGVKTRLGSLLLATHAPNRQSETS